MCPPPCGPKRSPERSFETESTTKYAAVFTIGLFKIVSQSKTINGLIDCLWHVQDLSCLSRQAHDIGDENDASSADKLDLFLEKYYEGSLRVTDIVGFHIEFSFATLHCIDFASGEDEILELLDHHGPKPAVLAGRHGRSNQDAFQHVRRHLGRPDIATVEGAVLALQQAFESDDPAYDEIKNCPLCQCFLGTGYWLHKGVEFDHEKAYSLYEKAAKGGLAKAQANLGIILDTGINGRPQPRAARFWYEKAAAQGDIVAQEHLKDSGYKLPSVLRHQCHDRHDETVIEYPLHEFIQDAVRNSRLDSVAEDVFCFDDSGSYPVRREVALLEKTDGPIQAQVLFVGDGDRKSLGSVFPVAAEGAEVELMIEYVFEWENGYEGAVEASIEDTAITFFMSNYFAHKHHLYPFYDYTFRLAAFAYDAEIIVEPEEPDSAAPASFRQRYEDYPDEVEFVSTVKSITKFNAWGGDFYKIVIDVNPDEGLEIPLYVKKSVVKGTPAEGMLIQGTGWLQGTLVEKDLHEYIMLRRGKDFPISGGNGSSMENAIVVDSDHNDETVSIEYAVLREYYAIKGRAYRLGSQFLLSDARGRHFDQIDVILSDPDDTEIIKSWYFDISRGFGNI